MKLTLLDKLFPAPQDGVDGIDGNDGVSYSIVCSNTNPNVTSNAAVITLTAYQTVGSKRTRIVMNDHLCFGMDGEYIYDNPMTLTIKKGTTTTKEVELIGEDNNNPLAICAVSPVVNGVNGSSIIAQYCPVKKNSTGQVSSRQPDTSNIHLSFQSGDIFMRTSSDGGTTWSEWVRIVGENGADGEYTDYTFNLSKDKTIGDVYTSPGNLVDASWTDAPKVPVKDYPYLWVRMQKKNLPNGTVVTAGHEYTYARLTGEDGKDGTTVTAQYATTANGTWHSPFANGDSWMRTSEDGGKTWGAAVRIVGEKGDSGAWTDYRFNISTDLSTGSSTTAPLHLGRTSWQDAPIPVTSAYPYLWMQVQHYSDADTREGVPRYVRLTGEKGPKGNDGDYYKEYYGLSAYDTEDAAISNDLAPLSSETIDKVWFEDMPEENSKKPYLWVAKVLIDGVSGAWKSLVYYRSTGKKGDPGKQGKLGPVGYIAGEWDAANTYTRSDDITPIVRHSEKYWYQMKNGSSKGDEPSDDSEVWRLAQSFEVVMARIVMAAFGKLASAVFSGDFMFSQYGRLRDGSEYKEIGAGSTKEEIEKAYTAFEAGKPDDGGFIPNLYINFLTGMMRSVKMKAYDMEAHGGTFDGVKVNGSITATDGSFCGKMNSPWTYAPGRGEPIKSDNIIIDDYYVFAGGLTGTKEDSGRVVRILNLTSGGVPITLNGCKLYNENGKAFETVWTPQGRCVTTLLGVGTAEDGFAYWQIIGRTDYLKTYWSHGHPVPVLAYGRVDVSYNAASNSMVANITEQSTFDGSKVTVVRTDTGKYRLNLPSNWSLHGSLHVTLTPYQYEFDNNTRNKRIVMIGVASISGYSIYIETADDPTNNDCSFFYEIKNMGELDYYN